MAHLYDSHAGKIVWFIRRFGFKELWMKPVRMLLAPVILPFLPRNEFSFQGRQLSYLYHAYNTTWINERCVEVPVARAYLERAPAGEVFEVGNVLAHYGTVRHQVLDKYERGEGVINADILQFRPNQRYRLVISISTFEHIGFDDTSANSSESSILQAIDICTRWLHPEGMLVITVPIGYNPGLDRMIRGDKLPISEERYLRRVNRRQWVECPKPVAIAQSYGKPFPYANAILIAEFRPSTVQ